MHDAEAAAAADGFALDAAQTAILDRLAVFGAAPSAGATRRSRGLYVHGDSRLLYFDELLVHDPGDARLLSRLLDHVFAQNGTVTVRFSASVGLDDFLSDASTRPDAFRMVSRMRLVQRRGVRPPARLRARR